MKRAALLALAIGLGSAGTIGIFNNLTDRAGVADAQRSNAQEHRVPAAHFGTLAHKKVISSKSNAPTPTRIDSQNNAELKLGRNLFVDGCSFCHGLNAHGIPGRAPSLIGVGALAADFYLSTGRMPLPNPKAYPERSKPAYPPAEQRALIAYIGSLGGPAIPKPNPQAGDLSQGQQAFALHCAGCHQILARGGIVTGAVAPPLQVATPTQIAEAVRIGPYVMPNFPPERIDDHTLNSIIRYVISTRDLDDRGGWGIGHIGPIPEGMIAWVFALLSLLIIARLIGERTSDRKA